MKKQNSKLDQRRAMYVKLDGGDAKAETSLRPGKLTRDGAKTTFRVTEDTKLYYARASRGTPKYEEFTLPHVLTFAYTGGRWRLSGDKPVLAPSAPRPSTVPGEPTSSPGTAPPGKPSATVQPSHVKLQKERKKAKAGKKVRAADRAYDYGAMIDYAERYALDYNPEYRSYDEDCTNFLSQIMEAGGWQQKGSGITDRKDNGKWYYGSFTWTTSYTWSGAENWFIFARNSTNRAGWIKNVWDMTPSDVLQADWKKDGSLDHSMFVVADDGNDLYLDYHTNNQWHKKLSRILAERPNTIWYASRT